MSAKGRAPGGSVWMGRGPNGGRSGPSPYPNGELKKSSMSYVGRGMGLNDRCHRYAEG